jgi:Ca2+-binding EF-hand superfamily protein
MQRLSGDTLRARVSGARRAVMAVISLFFAASGAVAAERRPLDDPKFTERSFATADKDDDNSLDEREMREALRIVRSALLGSFGNDLPGGKATTATLEELVAKARFDADGDGNVSQKEYNQTLAEIESRARATVDAAVEKAKEAAKKANQQQEQANKKGRKAQEKARREARGRATRKARRLVK